MWKEPASDDRLKKVMASLAANGIGTEVVVTKEEAKKRVLEIIPQGAEVMTMSSTTLTETGLVDELETSERYISVKKKLMAMDREKDNRQMQQVGAAPEYAIGSVHAITEKGEILIASNTGSQIPAYAYGADKVIWVVGTHKLVANLDEGMRRIYEYCFPLENERAKKAYGSGSGVNKILVINKEKRESRLMVVLVKEVLGF